MSDTDTGLSVQERYAPGSVCFGCGPANDKGLRIRSFEDGEELVCRFRPEPHHHAFVGVVNGGILGAVLDCHSNWAAAMSFMRAAGADEIPPTVTADFHVKLKRPTPLDQELLVRAKVVETSGKKAVVEASIETGGVVTATCRGTFVRVGEDHPAAGRW